MPFAKKEATPARPLDELLAEIGMLLETPVVGTAEERIATLDNMKKQIGAFKKDFDKSVKALLKTSGKDSPLTVDPKKIKIQTLISQIDAYRKHVQAEAKYPGKLQAAHKEMVDAVSQIASVLKQLKPIAA